MMFVSILQLMGFPVAKPVNSRASETLQVKPANVRIEGITSNAPDRAASPKRTSAIEVQAQEKSARRQEVKTQPGKAKVASKATKPAGKAKPAVKTAGKPSVKPKEKPAAKAKPVAKAPAKAASKPASRAQAKLPAKKAVAGKASAKPAVRGKESRPAPKVAAKVVKAALVNTVKPTAKVKAKDAVKTMIAKAGKPAVVAPISKKVASPTPIKFVAAELPVKPVAAPQVPARAGRPSSRLAQLTVPSMAQSVASTAAKASFSQTMSSPLIVPPLASAIKKDPKLANNWKSKPVEQLTDAEVIAMPDDEYMNDTQMAYFRRKLSALKKDILSNAGETTEHLREDTVVVPDPADRATIEEEHALELRTRDRERKLLKKIEQSIVRIDAGDYGYCDETGETIGVGRLLARPTANLSLEAQQRRELKQKMFGD